MNGPCIVIVEDEPLILASIEATVADAGYLVIPCANSEEGLRQLEHPQHPIAGLVTDIRLGAASESGWDVGRRARELFADICVVYISGDSGAEWRSQGVPDSIFIQKPFADAQLVTAMSTLLNAAG